MKLSKEFKIGLFVVSVLVISFFLINYLRGKDIFNKEIEIASRYADVEGLVASAPVYIKGYKAGKVTDVIFDKSENDFIVTCSVMKDFSIPSDSKMTIYGVDIMGGKGIRIDLGTSSEYVSDGDYLSPSSEPAMLDGLASGVTPLFDKLEVTLDSLQVTVASVNNLISDKNLSRTVSHIENTMNDVRSIASSIEGKSVELESFIVNLSSLSSRFVGIATKADTLVNDVATAMSALTEDDIKNLITSFQVFMNSLNDPEGTVGRLMVDDSVYNSVDQLLDDIDALVRKIEENPKKYIKISVF